ncbi:MAG TPA: 50S ribosomal protein L18 [bacterium]|nr:50S ribosomal protein L18 [bacterium]
MLATTEKRKRRQIRVRAKIAGTAVRPRLAVYKSNAAIYAQLIDDVAGTTLCGTSDLKISTGTKSERARTVGLEIAKLAKTKGIDSCVFDRGGFPYMGRVSALADGAREGGLQF